MLELLTPFPKLRLRKSIREIPRKEARSAQSAADGALRIGHRHLYRKGAVRGVSVSAQV